MLSQQIIKEVNKKNIYRLISENSNISRANISSVTNLSKATVSALVEELIRDGYVRDNGIVDTKFQGRKPTGLMVTADVNHILAVNFKKKEVQISLVSVDYEIKNLREIPHDMASTPEGIVACVHQYLEEYAKNYQILGVCMIVPGIIDEQNQSMVSVVVGIGKDKKFIRRIRKQLDKKYPLAIFNDTACLAYAENYFGDNEKAEDEKSYENSLKGDYSYIFVNINEGVGASLVQNGKILRGASGMGTQFGHFSIDRNGIPCICGNKGCLENYIGEMALSLRIEELGLNMEFQNLENIGFSDVAKRKSKEANILIKELARDLSFGLSNLITILHPDSIIIGGMGKRLGKRYLEFIKEDLKNIGFHQFVEDVEIKFSTLEEESVFIGATKYFMDMHYEFIKDMKGRLFLS